MTTHIPRGIANDNPGNVLWDGKTKWVGMRPQQTDGEMIQCISPEYGLRIILKVTQSYIGRGILTFGEVPQPNGEPKKGWVQTWCPPLHTLPSGKVVKNETAAYERFICSHVGVKPTDRIDLRDRAMLRRFLAAITEQENGMQPYSDDVFYRAMDLAGIQK